jgi:RNA polymerase sigma-70 factor (ECF subfamily)
MILRGKPSVSIVANGDPSISMEVPAGDPSVSRKMPASEFHRRWVGLVAGGASEAQLVGLAFDHCNAMVFAIANRITGSRWEAEDITQSVFENLARKLGSVRDPARIPGFLKTCAVRTALKQVKRGRWRREQVALFYDNGERASGEQDAALAASVRQLLDRMTPDERTAVVLKYVEMHSHEEVAKLMGVSVATARRRLDAAKKKVITWVGGDDATREILEQMRVQG